MTIPEFTSFEAFENYFDALENSQNIDLIGLLSLDVAVSNRDAFTAKTYGKGKPVKPYEEDYLKLETYYQIQIQAFHRILRQRVDNLIPNNSEIKSLLQRYILVITRYIEQLKKPRPFAGNPDAVVLNEQITGYSLLTKLLSSLEDTYSQYLEPESNSKEFGWSKMKIIILLNELGVIDHLKSEVKGLETNEKLAKVLEKIVDQKFNSIEPNLNALKRGMKNDPYLTKKNVESVNDFLINSNISWPKKDNR